MTKNHIVKLLNLLMAAHM